jgi:hypothetical protein
MNEKIQVKVINETKHSDCLDYTIRLFGSKNKLEVEGYYYINIEKNKRSNNQNNFYWNTLKKLSALIIKEYVEFTPSYLHKLFKENILGYYVKSIKTPTGILIDDRIINSTTNLSKKEFIEYIEKIRITSLEWFAIDIYEIIEKNIFQNP